MKRYGFKLSILFVVMLLLGSAAFPTRVRAASLTVNSLADTIAVDGKCTLREAIQNANNNAATNADCAAGSGADTITFSVSGTITLGSALPTIRDAAGLTMDGAGQTVSISGGNAVRVLYAGDSLTLNNLTIANGYSTGGYAGGGIYHCCSGTLTITNSTFSNNKVDWEGEGGGIYNYFGALTITNSTFSGNSASDSGGGIYNNAAMLTITNSTFSNNSASGASWGSGGGGIYNIGNGTSTITNSTFSGNSANYSSGGGMYNYSGTLIIMNSTFSGNSASGGSIRNLSGAVTLHNTIVANSPTGVNCMGMFTNGGNNLEDGTTCGWGSASGSMSSTNPVLGVLTGSPAYFPLNAGSPAIDAGNDSICAAAPVNNQSQNNVTRPQGAHCDIGSYESGSAFTLFPPVVIASDGTDNDKVNVSWTASSGATSYVAFRSDSLAGAKFPPSGFAIPGLAGADVWATPGVIYYYWVKACNATACSDFSAPETGSRGVAAVLTPPVVTASDGTFLDKVQVTWPAVSGATSYVAFRSDSPSGAKIPTTGFVTTNPGGADLWATPGVTYYYWVKACDATSCSDFSAAETGWR